MRISISNLGLPKAFHGFVHASVASASSELERHSRFMAANVFAGCAAFSVPFANVLQTTSTGMNGIALAGVGFPLIAAWMVSTTGDLKRAGYVSFAGFVSFLAGFGLLTQSVIAPLAAGSAALGLTTLLLWQKLNAGTTHAASAEAGRIDERVLVTTHDSRGVTLSSSGALMQDFALDAGTGECGGLANRIHLQDRIAFLKAVSDVAHGGDEVVLSCRIKNAAGVWRRTETVLRRVSPGADGSVVCTARELSAPQDEPLPAVSGGLPAAGDSDAQQRFMMTMSHELRTPLNAIVGFSDVLKREIFGKLETEKQHEYVGLIQESAAHLLGVVNGMLDFLRLGNGKYRVALRPFDFVDAAIPAINMLQGIAETAGVDLTCEVEAGLPLVKADSGACQQILINLLSNAIKFTPKGGAVRLTARRIGDNAVLEIMDSGIGMDAEFLQRVGRPFVQADWNSTASRHGTGLGLSLVKGLVDLQKGTFSIDSEAGRGTTVTVGLPLHFPASKPVPANEEDRLVRLSHLAAAKAAASQASPDSCPPKPDKYQSKGDGHARRSA